MVYTSIQHPYNDHIENHCNMSTNCRFSHSPIAPDFYNEYMKDNKDHILKAYK